jgi:isopenicillin-N epimerase
LPPGEALPLQTALWQRFGIEVPIIDFAGRRFVRVSCHLYNRASDIERLSLALRDCLQG